MANLFLDRAPNPKHYGLMREMFAPHIHPLAVRNACPRDKANLSGDIKCMKKEEREKWQKFLQTALPQTYARLEEQCETKKALASSDEAKKLLAERGYDPVYGARPLKRVIQKIVETPLAKKIMAGEVEDGSRLRVSTDEQGIVFEVTAQGEKDNQVLEAV